MFDVEELKGQRVSERLSHTTSTLILQDPRATSPLEASICPMELKLAVPMYDTSNN